MTFKKLTGQIHLWLGLASGLIVLIIGLTGCILVFEEEISTLLNYGVFQKVEQTDKPLALPSQIFAVADSALQDKKIARSYYTVYLKQNRVTALWALDSARQYHAVLQNPYTGKVVSNFDYTNAFFTIITHLHVSLAMGEVGTAIISYSTMIFVVLMITGLILWKPASKKGYKQRFTIKWNAKSKRLNYDLHNVLGFYMSWIAVIIAFTGLVWSFEWMNDSVQWIANGGKTITAKQEKIVSDTAAAACCTSKDSYTKIADSVFVLHARDAQKVRAIRFYKPSSHTDALRTTIETSTGANYTRSDDYYYDQYNGKLLSTQSFADQHNGEKLRRMNYAIHVGSIGGLTGKLLAFFASLIAASLPVTGLIVWKGRKKTVEPRSTRKSKAI